MINQFFGSFKVIGKENRIKSLKLLAILIVVVLLELFSIGLIIPILSSLFNTGENSENSKLLYYFTQFFPANISFAIKVALIFLFTIFFKIFFLLYFDYKTQLYCREINVDISLKAYSYFLYAPWEKILKLDHGYIMRNILSDSARFVGQGIIQFINLIKNTLFLFFILGYLLYVNYQITLIVLFIFSSFTIIFLLILKTKLSNMSSVMAGLDKFRYQSISEAIVSLRDIKLAGNARYFLDSYRDNEIKTTKVTILISILNKIPRYVLEFIIVLVSVIMLSILQFYEYDIISLIPTIGLFGFAILRMIPIFVNYNSSIQGIRYSKVQIDEVIRNAERFAKFYKDTVISADKAMNIADTDDISFKKDAQIKLTDVSFSYGNNTIFEKLNLEITKDQTIFIGGENGSGKSTLIDLIAGMLTPSSGKVEFNGNNIIKFSSNWQRKIGYVSQTNFLINNTIRNNIIFGRKEITDKNIDVIIEKVGLKKFIDSLPDKLETNVGSLGVNLSGGQKQRVAIARMLVTDPKIIILDEATNALDDTVEKNFLEIIERNKKGKIVIFIAHSNVIKDFCDIKILLKNKKIEII